MPAVELSATEEAALIRRAQAGDRHAFGRLVEAYMKRAYYAALSLVGSHDDALDLSQEAFARAFRARASLDPEQPFYNWYYTILRRLCFNFVRDRRRRRERLEEHAGWLVDQAEAHLPQGDPAHMAELRDEARRVRAAIERLPEREREMIVLKEFQGLKYREIAELLRIPIGTVMSRLYTARCRLARLLEEQA